MDSKKGLIALIGGLILAGAGYFLKEDVKVIVCGAPAAEQAK